MKSYRLILRRLSPSKVESSSRRTLSTAASSSVSVHNDSPSCSVCNVHSSLSSDGKLLDYARGWAWQQSLLSRRLEQRRKSDECADDADCVLMLEHSPVYTLGRGADETHLLCLQNDKEARERLARSNRGTGSARLSVDRRMDSDLLTRPLHEAVNVLSGIASPVIAPNGVPIYRVERGGEVTYHGPGMLVVYPLLDLKRHPHEQDLHWYLRMVEQVVIETLAEYEIDACRDEINTGVWVDSKKVAAVGVTASKWITTHGFALNVSPELEYFDTSNILPCGIEGRGVTSIHEILTERGNGSNIPSLQDVALVVLRKFQKVFDIELQSGDSLR